MLRRSLSAFPVQRSKSGPLMSALGQERPTRSKPHGHPCPLRPESDRSGMTTASAALCKARTFPSSPYTLAPAAKVCALGEDKNEADQPKNHAGNAPREGAHAGFRRWMSGGTAAASQGPPGI